MVPLIIADFNLLSAPDTTTALPPGSIAGMVDTSQIFYVSGQHLAGNGYANLQLYWTVYEAVGPIQDGGMMIHVDQLTNEGIFALLRADSAATGNAYALWNGSSGQILAHVVTPSGALTALTTLVFGTAPALGTPVWMMYHVAGISPTIITVAWWAGTGAIVPDPNSTPTGIATFTDSTGSLPSSRAGYMGLSVSGGVSHVDRWAILKDGTPAPTISHARPKWCPPRTRPTARSIFRGR
jgi:hypothetical protein